MFENKNNKTHSMILSTPHAIIEVKPMSSHPSLLEEAKHKQVEFTEIRSKSEIVNHIA